MRTRVTVFCLSVCVCVCVCVATWQVQLTTIIPTSVKHRSTVVSVKAVAIYNVYVYNIEVSRDILSPSDFIPRDTLSYRL